MSRPQPFTADPLTAPCYGCGRPDGIYMPHRREHVCPRCSEMYNTNDMAYFHLTELLEPVVKVWADYWTKRGVSDDYLKEILDRFGRHESTAWEWTGRG